MRIGERPSPRTVSYFWASVARLTFNRNIQDLVMGIGARGNIVYLGGGGGGNTRTGMDVPRPANAYM